MAQVHLYADFLNKYGILIFSFYRSLSVAYSFVFVKNHNMWNEKELESEPDSVYPNYFNFLPLGLLIINTFLFEVQTAVCRF